jgi:hypothetical protein
MAIFPMAILRRKKKPRQPVDAEIAELRESLRKCSEKIATLERERETDIKRMAAMQAAIDHLTARFNS